MSLLPFPPSPHSAVPLAAVLCLPLGLLCFFLPGRVFAGSRPGALPWADAFAVSFVFIFYLTLACDLAGVALTRALVVVTALFSCAWLLPRLRGWSGPRWWKPEGRHLLLLLPVLLVAGVFAQMWASPLSHWDNFFRWNHLALLIETNGSLAHYPPITDGDYAVYPWSDGIPPGVSILNAWLYLAAGSTHPALLIGRVAVELVLIFSLVRHLSRSLWGPGGALLSLGALSASALFGGAIAMNQESGLATVFVLLLAALMLAYEKDRLAATAVWAGLAAGACALVRDYNLLYIPVTAGLLMATRAPRGHVLLALVTATLVAAPWYLRNAWLTGNPLYPHTLGGLLSGNPMHDAFMHGVWLVSIGKSTAAGWASAGLNYLAVILAGGGVALVLGVAGCCRAMRESRVLWVLAATTVFLWLIALPMTAGGWTYGARVLAPALALAAIAAGAWGAYGGRRLSIVGVGLLACVVVDATLRAPRYFTHPLAMPFTFVAGPSSSELLEQEIEVQKELFRVLTFIAGGEGILADHPNHGVIGGSMGGKMVTLFSPAAAVLAPSATTMETPALLAAELRKKDIRFCIFTRASMNVFRVIPNLRVLFSAPPSIDLGPLIIYDCALLAGEKPPHVLNAIQPSASPPTP